MKEKPEEKIYTLQEARNMLLQLAGCGIEFILVNNAYENGDKVWPHKRDGNKYYTLVWKSNLEVIPKFDSVKDFWIAFEKPTFDETYVWVRSQ